MLDMRNNGFIINAMHTREGCYTYIKAIIDGNSVIVLSEEEQEALKRAMDPNGNLKNSERNSVEKQSYGEIMRIRQVKSL